MKTAYIALGANLGDPFKQLKQAMTHINTLTTTQLVNASCIYQSSAVGPGKQPDYLNSVVQVATMLAPADLLAALHQIETNIYFLKKR